MSQLNWISFLGLTPHLLGVLAYPGSSAGKAVQLGARDDQLFNFATIGDSWASGVTWNSNNQFDDNTSHCMRYKYAWSTVVNGSYADWLPEGTKANFSFKACSGAWLEDMMNQMDQLETQQKVVLMEAGGNNAIFYPMADACLFHSENNPFNRRVYGTVYEDDDPKNPTGSCRKEIGWVRSRVEGDGIKDNVTDKIHKWRGHKAVVGNDASLFLLGYARLFAEGPECNEYDFEVFYALRNETQKVVLEMRKEFNELVDHINRGIREAAESFNDPKIQYIDMNPAFNDHRFCEPGHSWKDQFNYSPYKVHFFNQPLRWKLLMKHGDDEKTYDATVEGSEPPPSDDYFKLIDHPEGDPKEEGDDIVMTFRNPDAKDLYMEIRANKNSYGTDPKGVDMMGGFPSPDGSRARTTHPTEEGHKDVGKIVVDELAKRFKVTASCPSECTCDHPGGTPLCP